MKQDSREEQFRTYVTRNRGPLLRTATLLASGDSHRAEDLVQTVLLRMYVAWPRIRHETRDAYARRTLVNAHLDERRRPHLRHERTHAELPDVVVEDAAPTDTETAVFRALAELPPRMRAAVVLRHLYDVSVSDTADALGCSEGTVKSQTARGLAQLRAALPELAGDGSDHPTGRAADVVKETAHE
ncbi:MAG: SigE family RNA polymerase sigma factor [Propionibacteriales bacterium]|nr:SigE family RNA polymerase sigma factor [Propionibacteriales bacterium]